MGKLFELGTVALVTGAARGLGRAIALEMAKEGADIIVNYCSNEIKALEVKSEIEQIGRKALVIKGDVSNSKDVKDMFKIIKKEFGQLHIVVNNAGIIKDGFLMMMSEKNFFDVLNTNMGGCFRVTQEALRMMCKEKKGSIINISSTSGITGQMGQTNYAASKGAIISFSKSVAKEYASYGIRCNVVAPGFIETDMTEAKGGKSLKETYMDYIPLKRFGEPLDVAKTVVFLASDSAKYITGQVHIVDGGLIN
ncbi:MAG: 3-oxoacyl-ACP reductase FabG [Lachnospiraceae bacterium]|jgi:3-oxoacyl-[acyl-carrier protein] reductase|nr:3-oxoacyl-ACP reductase FabG [Lachnospiraceae bacterium]